MAGHVLLALLLGVRVAGEWRTLFHKDADSWEENTC